MVAEVSGGTQSEPRERFTRARLADRFAVDVQSFSERGGRRRCILRVTLFANAEDVVGNTMLVEPLNHEQREALIRALGGRP